MENQEEINAALEDFCRLPNGAVPEVLDQYLSRVAVTGVTVFPWCKVKMLLRRKLDVVVSEFHERFPFDCQSLCPNVDNVKFEDMQKRLLCALDQFSGTPFTIQRLCELVTNPTKHYKRSDKFMRGVEKNLAVVTTVDSFGNRIVNESKALVNGLDASTEETMTDGENVVESSFSGQSGSLYAPSMTVSSPVSEASGVNASLMSLTTAVNSPNSSYQMAVLSLDSVTSSCTAVTQSSLDDSDDLEPPAKRPHLHPADEDVSTTASVVAPLLGQLLSSLAENNKVQNVDGDAHAVDDDDSTDVAYDTVRHTLHEDTENESNSSASVLSAVDLNVESCTSQNVDGNSSLSSLSLELDSDAELSNGELSELSSESNDNDESESDVSVTVTDTCADDVTLETGTALSAAADMHSVNCNTENELLPQADADDHRHFIASDRQCGDLKHDSHMSESILVSQVAMD